MSVQFVFPDSTVITVRPLAFDGSLAHVSHSMYFKSSRKEVHVFTSGPIALLSQSKQYN